MDELTRALNEYAKNYQGENEIIGEDDIIKAAYYLNNLYIASESDVLIFLTALNLCNSYAKQIKDHDIYKFKKDIATIIEILNNKDIQNIHICETKDKGNLYIFEIGHIQFSFHDEKHIAIGNNYQKDMVWDNIKKQPCAKTLFNAVIDSPLTNEAITRAGEPIKPLIGKIVRDYHDKLLTFEEIIDNM